MRRNPYRERAEMSESLEFVTVWISWSPVAYNRGCTLVIDGKVHRLDSAQRTIMSIEKGRHRFLFGDPVDGISLTRTEDLLTDVSIALGVKDAVPQPVLLFEIDERKPDVVPQEYDVHGNPIER